MQIQIGFIGFLTLLFIAMKLLPDGNGSTVIDWSWWWVLSPMLIYIGIVSLFFITVLIGAVIAIAKRN